MYLTAVAGTEVGIDAGRPGVPEFGRRIYRLSAFSGPRDRRNFVDVAIRRKVGTEPSQLPAEQLALWQSAYRKFVARLEDTAFSGVVLDYDGTLCGASGRRKPL